MTFKKEQSDESRFLAKVDKQSADGCWIWTAYKNPKGYGQFGVGSRTDGTARVPPAHRWAYEHWVGPIPGGLTIDHLCRNRSCVRPDHLEAVTQGANTMRGATLQAANEAKTHCDKGHEFTPENTYLNPVSRGKGFMRVCRECRRVWQRRYKAKLKRVGASSASL